MMQQLPTLSKFLKQLQAVPYLASKNLYRVADHFMAMDTVRHTQFLELLREVHEKVIRCPTCFAWSEKAAGCLFCKNPKRNSRQICVVETWHDLCAIERTSGYTGLYHVLGGVLCPLEGIGPEHLTIELLAKRVKSECDELILALNQTPEGEATAAFVARAVGPFGGVVTCLARGIPVGSSLEALDRLTVCKALSERRAF
jgi:recombination protein RecR